MAYSEDNFRSESLELNGRSAEEIILWAIRRFGSKAAIASSFGAEDSVLIDMAVRTGLPVRIFTLDTGRLPEETYQVMDEVKRRYRIEVEVFFPEASGVEALERTKGFYSFRESVENRKECCAIRKVEPLRRALFGLEAWMTGLRRGQSPTRSELAVLELDMAHGGILKINPLAQLSEQNIWDYIRARNVPYNKLHDAGFRSIGCQPCTRAVKPGEDIRSGRWWWEDPAHKECGLHRPPDKG